jgi:hypothetical protein
MPDYKVDVYLDEVFVKAVYRTAHDEELALEIVKSFVENNLDYTVEELD